MKHFLIITVFFSICTGKIFAQNQTYQNLCVGHYYTEEQGKKVLSDLREKYQTKDEWLKRAEIIKQGILEGADLVPFPEKTKLKPRFSEERKYNGYSVK